MFLNATETIGIIIKNGTENTTGSLFITLLIILLIILAIAIMFQIPLEYTAILILPLVISFMAYYMEWVATGAVLLIYISILLVKNWIFK